MLTLCICDDEAKDVANIRALAEAFAAEHPEFPLRIQTFSSSLALSEYLEKKGGFDLYLLDVLMPHLDGVALAKRVRDRNDASEVVFLTVSPEYALDAFDVGACGYLLKPVEKTKFDEVLLSAARRLSRPENPFILLKSREGLRKVLLRELVTVESLNHDRVCSLTDGSKLVTSDTLISLMERLAADPRFFSPHRAYIINLEHITALNAADVLMSNGQRVPVSRASLPALKKAYVDFLF